MSSLYAPNPWPAQAGPAPVHKPRIGRALAGGAGVQWSMKRNCSLAPWQLVGVLAALSLVSLGIALGFLSMGYPTVLPYAGLEVLLVAVAFWHHARHAADREVLTLRAGRLSVESLDGRRLQRTGFDAAFVRVEQARADTSLIELSARGQRVHVGQHLRPERRSALARELRLALREHGSGTTFAHDL